MYNGARFAAGIQKDFQCNRHKFEAFDDTKKRIIPSSSAGLGRSRTCKFGVCRRFWQQFFSMAVPRHKAEGRRFGMRHVRLRGYCACLRAEGCFCGLGRQKAGGLSDRPVRRRFPAAAVKRLRIVLRHKRGRFALFCARPMLCGPINGFVPLSHKVFCIFWCKKLRLQFVQPHTEHLEFYFETSAGLRYVDTCFRHMQICDLRGVVINEAFP